MSTLSDYSEKALLDHLLVNTAATPAATLYFGLFSADPGESGVTSEFTIGVGAYARAAVANNVTNFPPCAITGTPSKSNAGIIAFPTATATWGTATHWAIYDAATAGNMIAHGSLGASNLIQSGKTPKILAGAFNLSFTNGSKGGLTDYAKRALLDLWFGAVAFTPPTSIYLGAGTALSGDELTEWEDSSYTRALAAFTAATLGAGTCPNTDAEVLSSSVSGGTVILTHYGLWDDVSAGNLLATGAINSSKTVVNGDSVNVAAGAAVFTLG